MSTKRAGKLKVQSSGAGHMIQVASDRAEALHAFLRARCVLAGPPQPFTAENDSIQVGKGTDVKALQGLLDQFS